MVCLMRFKHFPPVPSHFKRKLTSFIDAYFHFSDDNENVEKRFYAIEIKFTSFLFKF